MIMTILSSWPESGMYLFFLHGSKGHLPLGHSANLIAREKSVQSTDISRYLDDP